MNQKEYSAYPILIVDNDKQFIEKLIRDLKEYSITNIKVCHDCREVMPLLKKYNYSLILFNGSKSFLKGSNVFTKIAIEYPKTMIIVLSTDQKVDGAVNYMKNGAYYYFEKPLVDSQYIKKIRSAINISVNFKDILTRSQKMYRIFETVEKIAASPKPVLITGETGVGKELIARATHELSNRQGEFVPVNTGGLDDDLFSDTLFGHKKGSFTTALYNRGGMIEEAEDGTLFLDEIGDSSPQSQVKLLRLIQEGKYPRLGEDKMRECKARIIVATNKDIKKMVVEGKFRKDLFYRLRYHHINIPPLWERKIDVKLLINYFVKEAAEELNKKVPSVATEVYKLLSNYNFPGNVRELEAMIFHAVTMEESGNLASDLFEQRLENETIRKDSLSTTSDCNSLWDEMRRTIFGVSFPKYDEFKEKYIDKLDEIYFKEVMEQAGQNQEKAAEKAGMFISTFRKRWRKIRNKFQKN